MILPAWLKKILWIKASPLPEANGDGSGSNKSEVLAMLQETKARVERMEQILQSRPSRT